MRQRHSDTLTLDAARADVEAMRARISRCRKSWTGAATGLFHLKNTTNIRNRRLFNWGTRV